MQFILHKLASDRRYVVDASFSGSSAIIVNVKRSHHTWTFCDSFWLFRNSLKEIGQAMGLEKSGPAAEESMSEEEVKDWYANVPLEELIEYNERDCRILYTAIKGFQELLLSEGGQLQKTIASCGMNLFRRKYLKSPIRTNNWVNEIAREAYHASRVEPIAYDCVDANYFDVNSSFPYSMTWPMPGEMIGQHDGLPDRLLSQKNRSYLVRARVKIPERHIPPIPYRAGGRIFFPIGSWESWFTDVDFELMIREGCKVIRAYESIEFDTFDDMAEYSMNIYGKRKKSKTKFEKMLYKYLLNCLYGKMAERPEKQKMWINPPVEVYPRLRPEKMTVINDETVICMEDVILPLQHVHVPISARITALSRRLLYDFLTDTTEAYYCDTDGFATGDDFNTGEELGQLKLEKRIIHGEFYAPKIYSLTVEDEKQGTKTILHAKGFSLGKREKEAKERFQAVIERREFDVTRMARIREIVKKGLIPTEKEITKVLSENVVAKRFFYPDGYSRAWHVEEIKKFT